MIKGIVVPQQIQDMMKDIVETLNTSIVTVREHCSPEEFQIYRRAIGSVMGEILLEVLNPLHSDHPSLKPQELK